MTNLQRLVLCLALCGLSACEVWLDVDTPQCKTNNDCVGLFGRDYTCATGGICVAPVSPDAGMKRDLPARWACADDDKGDFIDDPDKTVTIRMDAVDLTTLKVPEGITAMACGPLDVDCEDPVLEDVRPGTDGLFAFDLPYGFEGIIRFNAPGMVTGFSKMNRPYLESATTSGPALLSDDSRNDLADHAGHPLDPGTGIVILEIRDCADKAGDGVGFEPVEGQDPFYFDGALPSRTLNATTISNLLAANRENRAVAGYSNLRAPSNLSFVGKLASNGEQVVSVTAPVFPDMITYVRMYTGY